MSTSKQSHLISWRALARAATAAITMASALAGAGAPGAFAAAGAVTSPPGAVVSVPGGTFLWVADAQGVLHLVGDTRALAGHPVDWSKPAQVSLDQLQGASRGDPWLFLPLVKLGDAIYLPKWETTAPAPTLYHVQSAADLALLGLNGQNYGQLVRDQAAWEQQSGLATDSLPRAELPPVVLPATTAAPATTPPVPSSAAAANAASGTLQHLPQVGASTANGANSVTGVGGDVTFDLPAGRGWSDATNVDRLNDLIPLGMLDNEKTIAQWRVLTRPGGAYTY